jgi:hypothetical protein
VVHQVEFTWAGSLEGVPSGGPVEWVSSEVSSGRGPLDCVPWKESSGVGPLEGVPWRWPPEGSSGLGTLEEVSWRVSPGGGPLGVPWRGSLEGPLEGFPGGGPLVGTPGGPSVL